ncbi:MAG: hypothetical protein JXM73_02230, partial [Anaerolineae bacterium]|nr:hypothetical protein [Anaerolineae bacterium]
PEPPVQEVAPELPVQEAEPEPLVQEVEPELPVQEAEPEPPLQEPEPELSSSPSADPTPDGSLASDEVAEVPVGAEIDLSVVEG